MLTHEPQDINQPTVFESMLRESGITDPEFLKVAAEVAAICSDLVSRIDTAEEILQYSKEGPVHDQNLSENAVIDKLKTVPDDFQVASEILSTLTKPKVSDKSKTTSGNSFRTAIIDLTTAENHTRSVRRSFKSPPAQTKILLDFWQDSASPDTSELLRISELKSLEDEIYAPFSGLYEAPAEDATYIDKLEAAVRYKERLSTLPSDTLMNDFKLLVATELVRTLNHELVAKAVEPLFATDDGTKLKTDTRHFPVIVAADLLGYSDLSSSARRSKASVILGDLNEQHVSKRLLKIPNRKFKHALEKVGGLVGMYFRADAMHKISQDPENSPSSANDSIESRSKIVFLSCLAGAATMSDEVNGAVVSRTNTLIAKAQNQEEKENAWNQAVQTEEYRRQAVKVLSSRLEPYRRLLSQADKELLTVLDSNDIATQQQAINLDAELNLLIPELMTRVERINEIDSMYMLSNTQLRARHEDMLKLSKVLSESLNGQEALDSATARSLTGLILGVFHERTGKNVDSMQLVECYLEDRAELQQLLLELEFLGQNPEQPKLLSMLNLLDELIDSGLFDNSKFASAFEPFEDFLLTYMEALSPVVQPEEQPKPVNDTVADQPEVPVEALGQAEYEDLRVFPPGSGEEEIMRDYVQFVGEKELPTIEWERIKQLIALRDLVTGQNMEASLIRTSHASWQVLPFFILEVKLPDSPRGVAIVESPVYGNATYIYRESTKRPEWRDVVQKRRHEARKDGAVAMVHVDGAKPGHHTNKVWNRLISELTIYQ